MLSPATLAVIDRLISTLMTLTHATYDVAANGSTPTLADTAAFTLFARLTRFLNVLFRLREKGPRKPKDPSPPSEPTAVPTGAQRPGTQRPGTQRTPQTLPRKEGWLLAALPLITPHVAADLRALLEDPATAALLDTVPTLHRSLNPLLRALGITQLPTPSPSPTPPSRPTPPPAPPPFQGNRHQRRAQERAALRRNDKARRRASARPFCYDLKTKPLTAPAS